MELLLPPTSTSSSLSTSERRRRPCPSSSSLLSPPHTPRRLGVAFFILSFISSRDSSLVRAAIQQHKLFLAALLNPLASDPSALQTRILDAVREAITGEAAAAALPPRLQGAVFGKKALDAIAKVMAAEEAEYEREAAAAAAPLPFTCARSSAGRVLLDICADSSKGLCPPPSNSAAATAAAAGVGGSSPSSGCHRLVHFLSKSLQPNQFDSHQQLLFTVLDLCPGLAPAYLARSSLNVGVAAAEGKVRTEGGRQMPPSRAS